MIKDNNHQYLIRDTMKRDSCGGMSSLHNIHIQSIHPTALQKILPVVSISIEILHQTVTEVLPTTIVVEESVTYQQHPSVTQTTMVSLVSSLLTHKCEHIEVLESKQLEFVPRLLQKTLEPFVGLEPQ